MSLLNVRKITTVDSSLIKFIHEELVVLKRCPGLEDVDCYLACDRPGIYVAELAGEPIGFVSFNKYCSSYYTFGLYAIKEKYRGKGFGIQMFEKASLDVDWHQNVSAYALPAMIKPYERRYGFKFRWLCGLYTIDMLIALEILKPLEPIPRLVVKDINDVNKQALLSYDSAVFGYQRHNFIWKWLHAKGSHAKVVFNDKGEISGYAAARVAYPKKYGYKLGPLFANSVDAAQVLLTVLFEEIIHRAEHSSSHTISMSCPVGRNARSKDLIDMLQGKCFEQLAFITTKGIPNACFDKWFGITSLNIG